MAGNIELEIRMHKTKTNICTEMQHHTVVFKVLFANKISVGSVNITWFLLIYVDLGKKGKINGKMLFMPSHGLIKCVHLAVCMCVFVCVRLCWAKIKDKQGVSVFYFLCVFVPLCRSLGKIKCHTHSLFCACVCELVYLCLCAFFLCFCISVCVCKFKCLCICLCISAGQ